MKHKFVFFAFIFIISCSTSLTERGNEIIVVDGSSTQLTSDCLRLGTVKGHAKPGWGSEVGIQQAYDDARNQAGKIQSADTMAVAGIHESYTGGVVTGVVFNCKEKRTQLIQNVSTTDEKPNSDTFKKAKRCQEKDGVWMNNQCVINTD